MNTTRSWSRMRAGAAPTVASIAAALLLAWVIAFWVWRWVTPAIVHMIPLVPRDPVATLVASGWLASRAPVVAKAEAEAPTMLAGDVRLLGVFAETRGGGYALFRLPAGPKLVKEGSEIAGGSTLIAVEPLAIRIRDASGERTIALRADAPVKNIHDSTPRNGASLRNAALCTPPAGFRGQVVKLDAELLQGLATQPEALRAIVTPVAGGMSVRDDSGFAQMIGLKSGDRVSLANGIPLSSADDVMAAVLTPLAANQQVRLSGTRDGHAREMLLLNAGACPG